MVFGRGSIPLTISCSPVFFGGELFFHFSSLLLWCCRIGTGKVCVDSLTSLPPGECRRGYRTVFWLFCPGKLPQQNGSRKIGMLRQYEVDDQHTHTHTHCARRCAFEWASVGAWPSVRTCRNAYFTNRWSRDGRKVQSSNAPVHKATGRHVPSVEAFFK